MSEERSSLESGAVAGMAIGCVLAALVAVGVLAFIKAHKGAAFKLANSSAAPSAGFIGKQELSAYLSGRVGLQDAGRRRLAGIPLFEVGSERTDE